MKSYDYEACAYDGAIYCIACLPEGVTTEDADPIFAGSEWDAYPVCDHCGGVHDYVSLTTEGVRNELRRQSIEFFHQSASDFLTADDGSWNQDRLNEACSPDPEEPEGNRIEREREAAELAGYYWWTCFPGCLPEGDPMGPFKTEAEAIEDAAQTVLY